MNSDEIWLLQLWSGVIGSFIAAVVGGLVALMVVRLTNGHQSKLAARGRVIAAIGDFNSAVNAIPRSLSNGREPVQALVMQAEAAATRIMMELDSLRLADELRQWPLEMGGLAVRVISLRNDGDELRADEAQKLLGKAAVSVSARMMLWSRVSRRTADSWASELTAERKSFREAASAYSAAR